VSGFVLLLTIAAANAGSYKKIDGKDVMIDLYDARENTIAALEDMGFPIPLPGSGGGYSGKFIQRVPKSLHARLAARAKQEGISMNSLVITFLAESLGKREPV